MEYYTNYKYKKVEEDFDIDSFLVGSGAKKVAKHLESIGFKPFKLHDSQWPSVMVMQFSDWIKWHGSYSCYAYFNKHSLNAVYQSFSGAATGIEGWRSASFEGEIRNVKDLKTILRLTYVDKKIKEFSPKT